MDSSWPLPVQAWPCVLPGGSSDNVALACLGAHRSLRNRLPPGKLVGRLDNPVEPGEVLGEALAVSKAQVAHCALLLGLIGKYFFPSLPLVHNSMCLFIWHLFMKPLL